jgi:hypothetical protein
MFVDGLSSSLLSTGAEVVAEELGEVDVDETEVVLVAASMTNCGSSFMDMMVGWGKQRYIDRTGVPVQRKVPHAP